MQRERLRHNGKIRFLKNGIQGNDKLCYLNYWQLANTKGILLGALVSGFAVNL